MNKSHSYLYMKLERKQFKKNRKKQSINKYPKPVIIKKLNDF